MIQFCRIRRIEGNITDINSLRPFERGRLLFYRVLLMTQIEKRMRSKALSAQKRSKTPKKVIVSVRARKSWRKWIHSSRVQLALSSLIEI